MPKPYARKPINPFHAGTALSSQGHQTRSGIAPYRKSIDLGRRNPYSTAGSPEGTIDRRIGPFAFEIRVSNQVPIGKTDYSSGKPIIKTVETGRKMTTGRVKDLRAAKIPYKRTGSTRRRKNAGGRI
ncbi:MAG: hypothetical protein AABW99_02170 [archaeon]